eukprot:XP_001703814.1 predicted protein [Chlamydomonas reinhardtii]
MNTRLEGAGAQGVEARAVCKSIHLWQVPRWAACNQEVDAPAPLDSHIKITIVRDEAKTVPRNMLILTQVAQRLQEHGVAISDKTLARRLALLPKVLQLTVTDPMLLGRLKGLGAVKANAQHWHDHRHCLSLAAASHSCGGSPSLRTNRRHHRRRHSSRSRSSNRQ